MAMVNGQAGDSLSSFMMYIRILCVIFDFLSQIEMYMFFCVCFSGTISTHRSGRLPGAYVSSGKTTRVFNRPPRSRGRVLDVNFWFSRILGFLAESGPFAPLVFGIRKNITISRPFYVLFYVLFEGMADINPSVMM